MGNPQSSKTGVLIRQQTHRGGRPRDQGGRDRRDVAISQECQEPSESGRSKDGSSLLRLWREHSPADTLILDF